MATKTSHPKGGGGVRDPSASGPALRDRHDFGRAPQKKYSFD